MTIAEILDRAADLIEPEGRWAKGGYEPRQGCYCVLGAIAKATGADGLWSWGAPEMVDAAEAAGFAFNGPLFLAVDFNDAPERTQPEVVAKLREAAAVARERGL